MSNINYSVTFKISNTNNKLYSRFYSLNSTGFKQVQICYFILYNHRHTKYDFETIKIAKTNQHSYTGKYFTVSMIIIYRY